MFPSSHSNNNELGLLSILLNNKNKMVKFFTAKPCSSSSSNRKMLEVVTDCIYMCLSYHVSSLYQAKEIRGFYFPRNSLPLVQVLEYIWPDQDIRRLFGFIFVPSRKHKVNVTHKVDFINYHRYYVNMGQLYKSFETLV